MESKVLFWKNADYERETRLLEMSDFMARKRKPRLEKQELRENPVFVRISNQEVYAQIKTLQCTNDEGHRMILEKIESLEKKTFERINALEDEYHVEYEKIKGQAGLVGLTLGGVTTILAALIYIVLSHLGIKP